THNPNVGGSNPPRNQRNHRVTSNGRFHRRGKKGATTKPATVKCDNEGGFGSSLSFCFSHFLPVYHLDDFSVSLAFRFHHGAAVDVHAGGDLRVPQELLRTDQLCGVNKKACLIRIHRDGSWSAAYIASYKMKSTLFDRFLAVQ